MKFFAFVFILRQLQNYPSFQLDHVFRHECFECYESSLVVNGRWRHLWSLGRIFATFVLPRHLENFCLQQNCQNWIPRPEKLRLAKFLRNQSAIFARCGCCNPTHADGRASSSAAEWICSMPTDTKLQTTNCISATMALWVLYCDHLVAGTQTGNRKDSCWEEEAKEGKNI